MSERARHLFLLLAAAVAPAGLPAAAHAQRAVHATSDAVYMGMQAGPDAALLFAYDVDVLVTDRGTGLTLGPSLSVAFGGAGSAEHGRRQEWMLAADVLRLRWTLVQESYGLRFTALVGAGLYVASLPDQRTDPHAAELPDGTAVTVTEHFPGVIVPGPMVTTGFGCDWYWDGQWGLASFVVAHVRLDDQARLEPLWVELGFGVRLGQ